jgi:tRNA A37 methylthiotransferase MiaB
VTKFTLFNLGCRENIIEGNQIRDYLLQKGWEYSAAVAETDLIILNTCGFTQANEKNSIAKYNDLMKTKPPHARLILAGCLPGINEEIVRLLNYTDRIISPDNPQSLTDVINLPASSDIDDDIFNTSTVSFINNTSNIPSALFTLISGLARLPFLPIPRWLWQVRYMPHDDLPYIRAAIGCAGECSYCSIRKAKGTIKSYPLSGILENVHSCIEKGFTVIALSADDLGAYGHDIQSDFTHLIHEILAIGNTFELILRNVEPEWLIKYWNSFEPLLKTGRIRYLIIPMQSGCNKILVKMKRKYTAEDFSSLIFKIRKVSPKTIIRTHVITGFPGETSDDFKETYALLRKLPVDHFMVFSYSDRPGAASSTMPDKINEKLLKKRYSSLSLLNLVCYTKSFRWLPFRP